MVGSMKSTHISKAVTVACMAPTMGFCETTQVQYIKVHLWSWVQTSFLFRKRPGYAHRVLVPLKGGFL